MACAIRAKLFLIFLVFTSKTCIFNSQSRGSECGLTHNTYIAENKRKKNYKLTDQATWLALVGFGKFCVVLLARRRLEMSCLSLESVLCSRENVTVSLRHLTTSSFDSDPSINAFVSKIINTAVASSPALPLALTRSMRF